MEDKKVYNLPVELTPEQYKKAQEILKNKTRSEDDIKIPEKHVSKVKIEGKVQKKKKSRFAELFFKKDLADVWKYLKEDFIFPSVGNLIADSIENATDMIFRGEVRSNKSSRSKGRSSRISYNRYYDDDYERRDYLGGRGKREREKEVEEQRKIRYDYEDITFTDKGDAVEILSILIDALNEYKVVSINDYYDILPEEILEDLDIHPDFTMDKYGWTDLRSADVIPWRGEWKIKLPRALPLN
jgi:hypothetical protein